MAGGQQVFAATFPPAHRPVQHARQGGDREFFAIQGDLLPERTTDVRTDDRHLRFGQSQPNGELRAIGMWGLVTDMHRQMLAPLVPDGATAACLQRRMGLAVLGEASFHHAMRGGEMPAGIAGGKPLMGNQVAGQGLIDKRRIRVQGVGGADHRRQRFVLHQQLFGGVFRLRCGLGHDAGDQVAVEPHLVHRERFHGNRLQAVDRRRHPQRLRPLRQVPPGYHRNDSRHRAGGVCVDPEETRMGMRRAHEMHVQGAGKHHVVEIAALACQEAAILPAQHPPADLASGVGHRSLPSRNGRRWPNRCSLVGIGPGVIDCLRRLSAGSLMSWETRPFNLG